MKLNMRNSKSRGPVTSSFTDTGRGFTVPRAVTGRFTVSMTNEDVYERKQSPPPFEQSGMNLMAFRSLVESWILREAGIFTSTERLTGAESVSV